MFEQAAREKFRFESTKGLLTTEDLFDLPLIAGDNYPSLDAVAKTINRALKQEEEESFVIKTKSTSQVLQAKLDIVKHVIAYRLEQAEAAEKARANKAKKQQILEIIQDKQASNLRNMGIDELQKMIEEL